VVLLRPVKAIMVALQADHIFPELAVVELVLLVVM
jgi:hypothetical protein